MDIVPIDNPIEKRLLVLKEAMLSSLYATKRLASKHRGKDFEKWVRKICNLIDKKFKEYLKSKKGEIADFTIFADIEKNIRKWHFQIARVWLKSWGIDVKKRIRNSGANQDYFNRLLDIAGAIQRDFACRYYWFPSVIEYNYYNDTNEIISIMHDDLPSLDFIEITRPFILEMTMWFTLFHIPVYKCKQYFWYFLIECRPYLDWIYRGGRRGVNSNEESLNRIDKSFGRMDEMDHKMEDIITIAKTQFGSIDYQQQQLVRHMSIARHVTQIIHNEEEGPVDFEFLTSKIEQVLVKHNQVRAFISLCQNIEDRSDPRSKYHDKTINQILEQFGVARATYYRKSKKYIEFGLDGIIPMKPGPKSGRLPSQILSRIFELRNRQLSSRTIASAISLESQRYVSESTTQYQLRKVGKGKLRRNRKKKVYYKRFERGKPNELWQIDNVGPFYKPGKLFAYNVIDDHSRYNLAAVISDNQTTGSWVDTLEKLVQKYGVPEAILHDNGSQFVHNPSRNHTKEFEAFLKKYKIKGIKSRLRHPQTTGKVERVQQSLQYEARDLVFTETIDELQEAVDNWRGFYNKVRVHSSTKMTPQERYFGQEAEYAAKLSAWQHYEHSLIKFEWR